MIVSCPACNGRFNVDPTLLAPDGRKVRCAKCAHVWRVGADGMPAPAAPAAAAEAPVPEAQAAGEPEGPADVSVEPAAEAVAPEAEPPREEAGGAAPEGGLVMSARELLEREEAAGPSAPLPEAAAETGEAAAAGEEEATAGEEEPGKTVLLTEGQKAEGGEAGPDAEQAALANLAARREQQRGKRQKGGRKFQIFLLVLCLVVIALLAVAHFTGSFAPGGGGEGQDIPAVGDTPAPKNVDEVESKPAEGGHIIGDKE